MAWPLVALGAAQLGASIFGGVSAGSKARKAARSQARLTYAQRMEEIRREERQQDWTEGEAEAIVGASNIMFSGSAERYLTGLEMEHARQIAYAHDAARKERRAIKKGASGAGAPFFAQAAGDAIGLLAGMYANRAQPTPGPASASYESPHRYADTGGP
jgi:hypothetical protein